MSHKESGIIEHFHGVIHEMKKLVVPHGEHTNFYNTIEHFLSHFSTITVFTVFIYMIFHFRKYNLKGFFFINLLNFTVITYTSVPEWVTHVLYNVVIIIVALAIVNCSRMHTCRNIYGDKDK